MPEIIPINASVHYKCAFDVYSNDEKPLMTSLRKIFRSWCIKKIGENNDILHRSWFYIGNNPQNETPHYVINNHQIRTVSAPSSDSDEPACWAMELIHPDSQESSRSWSVEITLKRNDDNSVRFVTVTKHWMMPYFIGDYPDAPVPTVPFYVTALLKARNMICKRGASVLSNNFHTVTNSNAREIYDEIISSDRHAPYVFVVIERNEKQALIPPARITSKVKGNANVYYISSESAVEEINYYLGEDFRCELGAVRVYLPNLVKGENNNSRFHRFITEYDIKSKGEESILQFLANGLSRNGKSFRLRDLTSFFHIFRERRIHAIKSLASQNNEFGEEAKLVWDENEELITKAAEWETIATQYEEENENLQRELSEYKYRVEQADSVRSQIDDLKSQNAGVKSMEFLPISLVEVLIKIQTLFPKRVEIHDNAIQSAQKHGIAHGGHWNKKEQVNVAWAMTFHLATTLHEIMFTDKIANYEKEFNARVSNYELAKTEGPQTKKDSRLMDLRKIEHNGKQIEIAPHIKKGNKLPNMLRLHFAIDSPNKKFIIGHFGDHLENYSTGKK